MKRTCISCKKTKKITEFYSRRNEKYREKTYRTKCKTCNSKDQRERYKKYKQTNPFKCRCAKIKARAKSKNLKFNLTPEYLESIWTGICPISKIKIKWTTNRNDESAAELDRLIPKKGYIKGNVNFVSRKMNRLKNSANLKDIKLLCKWLEENNQ